MIEADLLELAASFDAVDEFAVFDESACFGSEAWVALSVFDPDVLKSVSYQPVPFSLNAAAVSCLTNADAPHAGQSVSSGSLILCSASTSSLHSVHLY